MHLKKLEMLGFKSFADKSEFLFPPGMTAVVGPNGCGKSNVVDAFKWILGEQSAKGLRGSEMKDVIFNGTAQRKPQGFAEVSVTFDNTDRFLDLDYSEVSLTRRLYRSGESEYLINKQRCRLKDIRGLFMGTGVGQTSYSILEQGKVDALLQANNIERRSIFEEAAGISRYLSKKAESVRALLRVEENLTRLNDIVGELEKRLQRVRAQASKARRFREVSERLKELKVRSAIEDYRESMVSRADISFRLHWCRFRMEEIERLTQEVRKVLEARVHERRGHAEQLREARDDLAACRHRRERTVQRVDEATRRKGEIEAEQARRSDEIDGLTTGLRGLRERIDVESRQLEDLKGREAEGRAAVEGLQGELETLRTSREGAELQLHERKAEALRILQERARRGNAGIQLESELASLRARGERLAGQIARFEEERAKEASAEAGALAEVERLEAEEARLRAARAEVEAARGQVLGELEVAEGRAQACSSRLLGRTSRHEVLRGLEESLEGINRGVADILRHRERLEALRGVHGMVASLVEVERKYAQAVEAALGPRAQALVVETQDGALGLLDLARSENAGGVEVISLDRVDRSGPEVFPRQAGVLGPLSEHVKAPEGLEALFGRLLANVVLVEDFATAIALSRNGLRPFRLVTLAGELVEPWGALAIPGGAELGIISRRSEMLELEAEIAQLGIEESAIRAEVSVLREQLARRQREEEGLREAVSAVARADVAARGRLANLRKETDRLERELTVGRKEAEEVAADVEQRRAEKQTIDAEVAELDAQKSRAEAAITSLEEDSRRIRVQESESHEVLTKARLSLAEIQQQSEGLREMISREEVNFSERQARLEAIRSELLALGARLKEAEEVIRSGQAQLGAFVEEEDAGAARVEAEEARDAALEARELEFRKVLDVLRDEGLRLAQDREAAQLRDQEERHRRNSVIERMDEEYGLDLLGLLEREGRSPALSAGNAPSGPSVEPGAVARAEDAGASAAQASLEPPPEGSHAAPPEARYLAQDPLWDREAARQEVRDLQDRLRKMGSVNLEALEELDELEQRLGFQSAQRQDLLESAGKLQGIISEINKTSRELFLKTFEEVQAHFSDLFRKCFGGGKAELVLEEGLDVLEAGIDIVAKPPGKKITSLSLMSGGEKTMTTIALLFAIFRARPSPFCILDEVDAPLDETNVRRYTVLLQDFLGQTQFIVVTHNKITMAEASTLYGVTMQEHGVSKRVSVELESYDPEKLVAASES